MKVLSSLNSPEQRAADWFSVGAAANDKTKKSLGGTRNRQPSHSRHLDYGQREDGSNQGVLMGMSWNSNLISQEGKQLQMLRLASPNACNMFGRNIDEMPQLDSRQLSEGEENVLATQRYTESSQ